MLTSDGFHNALFGQHNILPALETGKFVSKYILLECITVMFSIASVPLLS
jgi:hypothetical protein